MGGPGSRAGRGLGAGGSGVPAASAQANPLVRPAMLTRRMPAQHRTPAEQAGPHARHRRLQRAGVGAVHIGDGIVEAGAWGEGGGQRDACRMGTCLAGCARRQRELACLGLEWRRSDAQRAQPCAAFLLRVGHRPHATCWAKGGGSKAAGRQASSTAAAGLAPLHDANHTFHQASHQHNAGLLTSHQTSPPDPQRWRSCAQSPSRQA